MIEVRKEKRLPHAVPLRYSIYGDSAQETYECTSVDISTNGLGIVSDSPLDFGQFLEFESGMSTVPAVSGVVQWCYVSDGKYRAGLYLF